MTLERLTHLDFEGFNQGADARAYEKLGSHFIDGGVSFAVWAPEAERVSVIGDFNGWRADASPLHRVGDTGVWHGVVTGAHPGQTYKYRIVSRHQARVLEKADPYAFLQEVPPKTASVLTRPTYAWRDEIWMKGRQDWQALVAPISIYELHLGSWKRVPEEGFRSLNYREIAPQLAEYVKKMGFTHVELMPVMEHPFFGSWGYLVTGYFAPSHRYGTPEDFMFLVDTLHQNGIGVILDWVPAHFPTDAHGLAEFDGSHLYEHADPRQGYHPEWNSYIFNYSRNEVRSFLLSSAMFWLDRYHVDGLRVDGVASMLNLDYARKAGEWIPNEHGGRENLHAISFLKMLNETIYRNHPGAQTMAEESTAFPLVSKPTSIGGLGFGLKWDMGWMNDTLEYMHRDPLYRSHHHRDITFRSIYAYSENFLMPLSHDEVVYGKGSLLRKMPGDEWQRFANLRLLFSYMWSQPGKKLLFMGGEFGQWNEWNHDGTLDWHLLDLPMHGKLARLVGSLNHLYKTEPSLHRKDTEQGGFEWIDGSNATMSILTYQRRAEDDRDVMLVALNFTPTPRHGYRIGVPRSGSWREVLNSDAKEFGGSGHGNMGAVETRPIPWNGRRFSINVTLPPLGAIFLKPET
ncbi:1,4-alpha-glucan branching protein GlgB [Pendulispora albinea]|uniref:1,4-alpha-glucan branching enzyme GlgB n=1 Tax=Pendulispora albinea TaxID=2741071 RepID=A0ABZ2LYG5_9BACT